MKYNFRLEKFCPKTVSTSLDLRKTWKKGQTLNSMCKLSPCSKMKKGHLSNQHEKLYRLKGGVKETLGNWLTLIFFTNLKINWKKINQKLKDFWHENIRKLNIWKGDTIELVATPRWNQSNNGTQAKMKKVGRLKIPQAINMEMGRKNLKSWGGISFSFFLIWAFSLGVEALTYDSWTIACK